MLVFSSSWASAPPVDRGRRRRRRRRRGGGREGGRRPAGPWKRVGAGGASGIGKAAVERGVHARISTLFQATRPGENKNKTWTEVERDSQERIKNERVRKLNQSSRLAKGHAGGRAGAWRFKFQRPSIPELWLDPLGDIRLPKRDITASVRYDELQAHASRRLKQVKSIIIKSCRAVGTPQSGALGHVAAVSLRLFPLLPMYPHTRPRLMYIRDRPIMCSFQASVFRPVDSIP